MRRLRRYRKDYQITHDIDWFFIYKGKVYHAASNGGLLPDAVYRENNRKLQVEIEKMEATYEIKWSPNLSEFYDVGEEDLGSFEEYAKKGFVSLDRTETEDGDTENENSGMLQYHVVSFPGDSFKNQNLLEFLKKQKLLELMPELKDDAIEITE